MTIGRIFEQRDQIRNKFSLSSFMFFRGLGVANVATAAKQRKQCTENMSNPPASLFQNGGEMLCKDVQSVVSNTVISLHCRCTKTGSKALILEMNQRESFSKGTRILRTEQRVSMQVQFLLSLPSPKGGKECLSATAPITSNSQPSFVFK